MKAESKNLRRKFAGYVMAKPDLFAGILLGGNFLFRLIIFKTTTLFSFSDYAAYLDAVEKLKAGEHVYLLNGNFLFAVSYLGYFAEKLGSLDIFFVFNCLVGTLTGLVIYILLKKVTGSASGGLVSLVLLTVYTEYMVFSSVFYTPVIMIFLVSLILLSLWYYIKAESVGGLILPLLAAIAIFLITFFFKPELKYLPWFLLVGGGIMYLKRFRGRAKRVLVLAVVMAGSYFAFNASGIINRPAGNVISNSFVFFGHTSYGGDGGEGAFIYSENKEKYEKALAEYCAREGIAKPDRKDINKFQAEEVIKFIKEHPFKWTGLQFTKFFRTFGVVPESTSFRVLYTGLFGQRVWLTAGIIVLPVIIIIILLVIFYNHQLFRKLLTGEKGGDDKIAEKKTLSSGEFLYVCLILFFYYLIATIFYGHYQERYRMPLMVIFIIPAASYFIVNFVRNDFFKRSSLAIKGIILFIFLTVWVFQAVNASGRKDRYKAVIEKPVQAITGRYNHDIKLKYYRNSERLNN